MILLVLQAAALAVLVTQGSIFDKLREIGPKWWRDLLTCPLCFGTWTGMFGAILIVLRSRPNPSSVLDFVDLAWFVLSAGALSGALGLLFVYVIERLGGDDGGEEG